MLQTFLRRLIPPPSMQTITIVGTLHREKGPNATPPLWSNGVRSSRTIVVVKVGRGAAKISGVIRTAYVSAMATIITLRS